MTMRSGNVPFVGRRISPLIHQLFRCGRRSHPPFVEWDFGALSGQTLRLLGTLDGWNRNCETAPHCSCKRDRETPIDEQHDILHPGSDSVRRESPRSQVREILAGRAR